MSLLSVSNCLGRLAMGFSGDYTSHHFPIAFRFPRVRWYIAVATGFLISQVLALSASSVGDLFLPTVSIGCVSTVTNFVAHEPLTKGIFAQVHVWRPVQCQSCSMLGKVRAPKLR